MSRFARLLLLAVVLAPAVASVGCDSRADSTPNTALGPPPKIPAGRGGGDHGIAPTSGKAARPRP